MTRADCKIMVGSYGVSLDAGNSAIRSMVSTFRAACLRPALTVLVCLSTAAAFAAPATQIAKPAPPSAGVALSRAFGYTIGDRLQQRVALGTVAAPFVLGELPRLGRIGSSLWRHRSVQQTDVQGQHWLLLDYQLVNTPPALGVWYLPTLKLKAATGGAVLAVASTPFSIGPLTTQQPPALAGLSALQPDQPVALAALALAERRIRQAAAALLLALLVWAAVTSWRYLRRGRHLPFACAVRDLGILRAAGDGDPLAARRLLHQALNASAGSVVQPASIDVLLTRAPHLATERGALENFLRQSQAIFFAGTKPGDGSSAGAASVASEVTTLARRLRRLEQRHAT